MLIAHVELRDEESPDIRPYQHERKVEKIVVKLGQEITSVRDKYLKVFNLLHLGHYEIIGQARLLNHVTVKALYPTCLYTHKYFGMTPVVNISHMSIQPHQNIIYCTSRPFKENLRRYHWIILEFTLFIFEFLAVM